MTKKCLHEGEKSAPFLRQKPVKNALFPSISQEKLERNEKAKCYIFRRFMSKVYSYLPGYTFVTEMYFSQQMVWMLSVVLLYNCTVLFAFAANLHIWIFNLSDV